MRARGSCAADRVFVLAASGHIAGVINPASRNRRNYWLGGKLHEDARSLAGGGKVASGKLVDALGSVARASRAARAFRHANRAVPTTPGSSRRRVAT